MRPAAKAICALLGGVAAWDVLCEDGETISEGLDGLLADHRIATETILLALYLHCSNRVPNELDAVHWLFVAARWTRKQVTTGRFHTNSP